MFNWSAQAGNKLFHNISFKEWKLDYWNYDKVS